MKEYYFEQKKIYYRTNAFEEHRPTLVFVHGISGSSAAWLDYEQRFGKAYNILSFDLRGHGRSAKHAAYEDYTLQQFVDDLHALLTHLHIVTCTLISHSFGTLVALDYLLQHPEHVVSTVFLSPNFSINQKGIATLFKIVSKGAPLIDALLRSPKQGGHTDYSKYVGSGDWHIPRIIADTRNTGMRTYLHCARHACDFQRLHLLNRIAIPTLIIHGRKDTIFPMRNSIELQRRIKGSELAILEHAHHAAQQVVMKEAADIIQEFLEKKVYTNK